LQVQLIDEFAYKLYFENKFNESARLLRFAKSKQALTAWHM